MTFNHEKTKQLKKILNESVTGSMHAKLTHAHEIMKLIRHGANPDVQSDNDGNSALHILIRYAFDANSDKPVSTSHVYPILEMVEELVQDYHADINLKNSLGLTPLMRNLTVSNIDQVIILKMLQLNADPNAQDIKGLTLMHLLAKKLSLCQLRAKTDWDRIGYHAITPASKEVLDFIILLAVKNFASIEAKDSHGRSVLQYYLDERNILAEKEIIISFLKLGANPDVGITPHLPLRQIVINQILNKQEPIISLDEFMNRGTGQINIPIPPLGKNKISFFYKNSEDRRQMEDFKTFGFRKK